jgi:ATP-dependent exoDNAse (exonuclease V) alpha subunit
VAGAAYRAADKLYDRSLDQSVDYSGRAGVAHAEIVLPRQAAQRDINWARNRQALWNAAEAAEKRKDSRVAREHEVALPHELTKGQQIALLRAFAGEIANRYNVAVDFALHRPHRSGDQRNFHAHVYATTRECELARREVPVALRDMQLRGECLIFCV